MECPRLTPFWVNNCIDGSTIHGLFTVSVSGCNLTWTGTTDCGGITVSFSSIIFTDCCPSFVVLSVARASYRTLKSPYCCSKSLPISISVFGRDIIRAIPFAFLFRMVMFTSIPNSGVKVCPFAKLTLGPFHSRFPLGNFAANTSDMAVIAAPVSISAWAIRPLHQMVSSTRLCPTVCNAWIGLV